jgi:hypothetical protein
MRVLVDKENIQKAKKIINQAQEDLKIEHLKVTI